MDDGSSLIVCKIGGSLLTDKADLMRMRPSMIAAFAREFGALASAERRRLLLIAGGGSFGNASAHGGFASSSLTLRQIMELWSALLEGALRAAEFDARVILGRKLWRSKEGRNFDLSLPRKLLRDGTTPVLLGDMLQGGNRDRLMSSDLLPMFICRHASVRRVVMLTDVPGVYGHAGLLSRVSARDREVISYGGPSSKPDVTGGMRLKVRVMLNLAARGVEGVVCSGMQPKSAIAALYDSPPPGTWFCPTGASRTAMLGC